MPGSPARAWLGSVDGTWCRDAWLGGSKDADDQPAYGLVGAVVIASGGVCVRCMQASFGERVVICSVCLVWVHKEEGVAS